MELILFWQTEKALKTPGVASPFGFYFVGPIRRNQPRIINVGSADPTNQQANPPSPPPQLPNAHVCSLCNRSFSKKTGLGVHMRKTHPDELDQMRLRQDVKARWNEEEMLLIARKEAELTVRRDVKFMNQALAGIFTTRTLEAIKKLRQKPPYRDAVRRYLDELEAGPSHPLPSTSTSNDAGSGLMPNAPPDPSTDYQSTPTPADDNHFIEHLLSLPPLDNESYNGPLLQSIIARADAAGKDTTFSRLTSYLLDIFPTRRRGPQTRGRNARLIPRSKKRQRRREYAITQRNWAKHQGRCIKSILDGPNMSIIPPQNVMEPFWREVMERECTLSPPDEDLRQSLDHTWSPVTADEIVLAKLPISTSPGPDGITSRQLRAVPTGILERIYNLILWCGRLPIQYEEARTIFIPKKGNSTSPGDFRPITIPSVIVRHIHSILARRLMTSLDLDPRQRGFQPTDGCADNVVLIDLLLRDHHQRYASCYIASLDVGKAFDSVSHDAIFGAMRSYGFPKGLIQYLRKFYSSSSTCLVGDGWSSPQLRPKRGVKQGDPLSPIIFNLIIDRLLRSLPKDIGCSIGVAKTNAIAFADDLVLCASTPRGLQILIDTTRTYLASCGMTLNSAKCLTISIKGQPKQKITVIEQRSFKVGNNTIPSLKRSEEWKYLGISFTPDGKCKYHPQAELHPKLDRLSRAPLKPQQRLHALRTVLIPQLYHKLTLGNIMIGCLNKTDKTIRSVIRKWLNLPKDTPIAFFHAPIEQGGLGIPSVRWQAPYLRKHRLENLQLPNMEGVTAADTFIATELEKVERRLRVEERSLSSTSEIANFWSHRLHTSVDGFGLRESGRHKQAHRWIREPSKLLTGRDFVNCVRLRINALPSRSRTTRGRHEIDRTCRAGCDTPETLNHIVQQCHRTHAGRIDRHNSVVKFIGRSLNNKGFITIEEPTLRTSEGNRKPDLIATIGDEAVVLDAQIVTDGRSLDDAHKRKIAYYNTSEIKREIQQRYAVRNVMFTTATLNWRGIWSGLSVDQLLAQKIIKSSDTALISTRVAIGTLRCFRIFSTTTSVQYRTGVG